MHRALIRNIKEVTKMRTSLEKVTLNNDKVEGTLKLFQSQLCATRSEIISKAKSKLIAENVQLAKEIEMARRQLILLETRNGKHQINVPGARSFCTSGEIADTASTPPHNLETPSSNVQKEKKVKKEKPKVAAVISEAPIDVGRLDFRVGKIIEVKRHPDADTLYLEQIDCGEPNYRTVVSGLVKNISLEEMQNRMVVILCNLKPAKMRGVTSEAMVMCAVTPEKVEVLSPPPGSIPGDLVYCDGFERQPDVQLNPKKKIFETCAPDLTTNNNLVACYKGVPLHVPGKGNVVAQSLKNVNVK